MVCHMASSRALDIAEAPDRYVVTLLNCGEGDGFYGYIKLVTGVQKPYD